MAWFLACIFLKFMVNYFWPKKGEGFKMQINAIRTEILNEIIELYQDTEHYERLLELIIQKENIVHLLKSEAVVYQLLMSSNKIVWNGNQASPLYGDYMARYQKGYQLYLKFAYYFLGANVVYPSLDCQFNENLKDLSLLSSGKIDYQEFLNENINVSQRKLA